MEAGLSNVTGDDSGGVFTGLAPLSTRSTSKSASLQCNQPPPRHLFDSCGPICSVLPVFIMGFGNNKAYAATNYNQQFSLKC